VGTRARGRAAPLHTRQVTFTSVDGTEVRMFLIMPEPAVTRPRPTVLYGYGGFNHALTPVHSPDIVAWVEAGGVFAVANLRGGSEEGEAWHRAGTLGQKQNVFDDFDAAARWLVDAGLTTPAQLGLFGASNGGLLVAAALTQRPDRCAAVVCSAPLIDMVRYELFGLGSTWTGEYGTVTDPEQFGWLLAYSPYHNVAPDVDYPRCWSRCSSPTPGSTRCTGASWRRRCSTPRPAPGRSCSAASSASGTARAPRRGGWSCWPTSTRFLAHQLGLRLAGDSG
jgi:prolyl oligopeptidase